MKYETLSEDLIERLPALREEYEAELAWWGHERPGPHVIYGDILNRYLQAKLRNQNDREEIRRIFSLLEELASNPDGRVQDVLLATVLEALYDNADLFRKSKDHMGRQTLKLAELLEKSTTT
jgi:hypothetical protein